VCFAREEEERTKRLLNVFTKSCALVAHGEMREGVAQDEGDEKW
jgi:hypothetical protein